MKFLYKLALSLLIFFSVPTFAYAATYYVSTTGSDTNAGTQTSPWKTIQKAANTMVAGDTVNVAAGDYSTQRVNITKSGSSGSPIIYQAQGQVVMKGFNIVASYIKIDGFEIANSDYKRWDLQTDAGVYVKGAYNTLENNYIHDASMNGIELYGTTTDSLVTHDNIIRNNRVYHNEMVGIEVSGRNNLIEKNEIWGTVQCHPTLTAVEDLAADNHGAKCPNYAEPVGLDADGMRFFGQGHIIRGNYIHDIPYGPLGINPALGDYNDDPHVDCFQTWNSSSGEYELAQNIIFTQNFCDNLQHLDSEANGSGFMLEGGVNNLTITNNIIRAYAGVNAYGGADHLYIYNNLWVNDLSFTQDYPEALEIPNATGSVVENNIFYDQPLHTVYVLGNTTDIKVDYNLAYNSNGKKPECIMWGTYGVCMPATGHNFWNINPQFVDPTNKDYHLQSTSPAINAGITVSTVTNDYNGNSRPQGAGYDIGAYEYVSGSSPTPVPSSTPSPTGTPQPTATATPIPTPTPTPTIKPGDANGDGKVDETDYGIWLSHFGQMVSGGRTFGDFNSNGIVDGVDYTIWLNTYGT